MFDFINKIDWNSIAEKLKTENLLEAVSGVDPIDFFMDPSVLIPSIVAVAVMIFFKLQKLLSLAVGLVVLWIGINYALPETTNVALGDVGLFAAVCIGVAGFWVYMFIIKD